MRFLRAALDREKYSVSMDSIRKRIILSPNHESKVKHASLHPDEAFMLACFLLSLSRPNLTDLVTADLKGVLGPNFWKVANQALVERPRKKKEEFEGPLRSENYSLRKEIDDLKESLRLERKCLAQLKEQIRNSQSQGVFTP